MKSYSCIIFAIIKNEELPGTFNSSLDVLFTANNLPKIKINEFQPPSFGCLRREDLPLNTCKDAFPSIVGVDVDSSTRSNVASPLTDMIVNSLDNKSAKTASEILLDNRGESRDDTSDSLVNDCKIYKKKGCCIEMVKN